MNKQHLINRALSHANSLKVDLEELGSTPSIKLLNVVIHRLKQRVIIIPPKDYQVDYEKINSNIASDISNE